jgi:hypoxanthine phosphoribosyltransferase
VQAWDWKPGVTMQDYKEFLAEVLIDKKTLQKRVKELAQEINRDYAGKDLLLICILRGGIVFLVDLMRYITVPLQLDFMAVTSYGAGVRQSGGSVRLSLDLKTDIRHKEVLLVEDIVDSGNTIAYVLEFLQTRQPRSLKVCTLLDKEERRETSVPVHYRGFSIPNKFVFGYGLDLDEYYRNLPFIAVVDQNKYHQPG